MFGNAVQDITVEVDVERLSHESGTVHSKINLADKGAEIEANLWLKTQIGGQEFAVQIDLQQQKVLKGSYLLEGGGKYTLKQDIRDSHVGLPDPSVFVPCENVSWGGGGANVITFLRALAPSKDVVPIKYTDIAMSRPLAEDPILEFERLRRKIVTARSQAKRPRKTLYSFVRNLYDDDPVEAEDYTAEIAGIAAAYAPERSLEVYLASLPVESVLFRPRTPRFRRNWVFSRFKSAYHELDNKIILRGSPNELPDEEEPRIKTLLGAHSSDVGALLLNSLRDGALFRGAYSIYERAYLKDRKVIAILAMTDAMTKFTKWLLKTRRRLENPPPLIIVVNETELYKLARMLGGKPKPFIEHGGLPEIRKFALLALALQDHFDLERIYVTLGPRGSLGVDRSGQVVYVSSFSKSGAVIYDTNACGDAYCAAVALLEWAKRHGSSATVNYEPLNIAHVDFGTCPHPSAEEMRYFMSVATAASYCKATNRRGRIYAADMKDLLQYNHLASSILPPLPELRDLRADNRPHGIDARFFLREPAEAKYPTVTPELNRLIS